MSQNLTLSGDETTALFVPGDRPDRFLKAQHSGAKCIVVDLEDAVADSRKSIARDAIYDFLATPQPDATVPAIVRINPADSTHFAADVELVNRIASSPSNWISAIMIAKAESPADLVALRETTGRSISIIPLIETAAGMLAARDIAQAEDVVRLAFGAIDYSLDVGCSTDNEALLCVRSQLVMLSRASGILPPWDSPTAEITNKTIVLASAQHARKLGFGGKLCIHPSQVSIVADGFTPTDDERAWALRVLGAGDGASKVDGTMVDRPVIARAHVIIEQSKKGMAL